jgi:prolyl-tRNA synthetase
MANNKMNLITPRDVDFAKWYTDVVKNAGLIDYGQVKGTMIFKPYGFAIWENIQRILDAEFKKLGVQNVYFPLLIPKSLLTKEADHVEGFAPELATVTKVGNKQLEEELYIRPTSETLIMSHFAKEVTSYRDLPMLYNQWTNVMRWEKTTRPFLRTSEFLWQEGHTIHSNPEEAKNLTMKILGVYEKFAKEVLCLPVITGQKTEHEKFAGAAETYTIESIMHDGQSLQSGTSHYFGNNFTKAFDIKFQSKEQKEEFGFTTSWGVSTRLIGAIIMSHSDDFGLVLPSKVSPVQIQIIKIKDSDEVNAVIEKIKSDFSNYRVFIDESDKSFGFKISEAEIKGVPIRIEVGPRDLENNSVTVSRRDLRSKESIKLDDLKNYVEEQMKSYDENIFNIAKENRDDKTFAANTIDEYQKIISEKNGIVLVPFCGEISCEADVKTKTSTNSRCIKEKGVKGKCFNCQKDSDMMVYFGRAY